ncbi:hypothetical protein LIER_40835 [Lithospermum erythrorhizon]|uniref:Uncharacterized protein n=1 Tax=Lithospermum erythrorhizon TaxID=34254 RepID=A0AAV3R4D0_LITER
MGALHHEVCQRMCLDVCGLYRRSNSLSSIAHLTIHPDRLGFSNIFHRGWSVTTSTGCASKQGLSFRAATTRAYTSFSIKGYLVSAPHMTRLT